MKLLIDVDTGIDDALALLYACASSDAELLGVTCTSGNVEGRQVATNTLAVLELAGRGDIEVALGREVPLVRPLDTAKETHGPQGIGHAVLPPPRAALSERHGADVIIETARSMPGEVTLVTVAPLTNLAVALQREPALPTLLRGVVMMGGVYRSPGNTTPTSEWNVAVDPEAMQVVLDGWAAYPQFGRPTALGLDVTERAKMTPEHIARLEAAVGGEPGSNPVVRFIDDALRFYMEFHSHFDGFYGAFIHDALAVAAALDPTLIEIESLHVQVELEGRHTTGQMVTDWRRLWGRPPNLDVAIEADVDTFFDRFIDRVAALAAQRSNVAL
ncbi:MAG TPA: nucleoside hydrolase [Candidatus Limnocylindrales bacterium]|nr:nucleoside hydrolase [Candidatus Limnocylindrales bacterium]